MIPLIAYSESKQENYFTLPDTIRLISDVCGFLTECSATSDENHTSTSQPLSEFEKP